MTTRPWTKTLTKIAMTEPSKVTVRPATARDADPILSLVNELAVQQIMLPRSPASVIENLRDFAIAEVDGEFAGCGALAITWTDLAEAWRITQVLAKCNGNRSAAARQLGIGRRTLYAKMEKLQIVPSWNF